MQKVLATETTQNQTTTTTQDIIKKILQNTSYQVESDKNYFQISNIISQFKLLMEYLPAEDYLEETLENLLMIRKLVREENRSLLFELK